MTTAATKATASPIVRTFRLVAALEATSWLVLIVATAVKYATTPHKQLGVQIMGPIHGVLFIVYVVLALMVMRKVGWTAGTTLVVLLDSVIPFGGFVVARRPDLRDQLPIRAA